MNAPNRAFPVAVAISLLLHGLLVLSVLRWGFAKAPPPPARIVVEMLAPPIPQEPPPPPREPEPIRSKAPVAKAAPAPAPARTRSEPPPTLPQTPVVPAEPAPQPGPPQHKMKSAGGGATPGGVVGGSGTGRKGSVYAPPDYAEKVKQRVNAAIVYPADAKRFLQQCWVEYTLTVDRNGNLMGTPKIENCGDDRLDAAAYAALLKGSPYPPPPDTGATSYEIHGAIVFTLR